jgi:hypothetical protein
MDHLRYYLESVKRTDVEWVEGVGTVVRHTEYFPGMLERAQYLHKTKQYGDRELPLLMYVPGILIEAWCQKHGITFATFGRSPELKKRFINDPDLSLWRVWGGRA